jgi:CheY-like chemotaxis protein
MSEHQLAVHGTILAIDDHPEVLAAISAVLGSAGYDCHCCQDMTTAMAALQHSTPELIISDVNLHGHSGLEFCDELRRQFGLGEVPVMFLSSSQGPDIIRRVHAHGGAYHLRKPFDAPVLVQLVDKVRRIPVWSGTEYSI